MHIKTYPKLKDEINEKVASKLKDENVFDSPFSGSRDEKEGFIAHSKYDDLLEKFNIRDMGLNVKIIKKFNPTESNLDITNLLSREIIKFLPHHFFKFNSFGPYIEIYDLNSL